jgi:hypothetical protein
MSAFAYTIKNRPSSAPECFSSINEAVAYLTGVVDKPWRLRGSGNSPLYAHYNTGTTPQEIILDEYMVRKDLNTGAITNGVDNAILYEEAAYNRVYSTERHKQVERAVRPDGAEWLFEKDRQFVINRELEIRRWSWSGQTP